MTKQKRRSTPTNKELSPNEDSSFCANHASYIMKERAAAQEEFRTDGELERGDVP